MSLFRVPYLTPTATRAGISLLEVLISIGILSIGLLATLALIPAGRSYMQKAAVDDRAAAIVPAAFAAVSGAGLLAMDASSWEDKGLVFNAPEPNVVIREQVGGTLNPTNGAIDNTAWSITSITSEQISQHWRQPNAPNATITGQVAPGGSGNQVNVSLTISAGGAATTVSPNVNQTTGAWAWTVFPNPLLAPAMTINTSGANIGQPNNNAFTDYSFAATVNDGTGPEKTASASPSGFRQYGQRRRRDTRQGVGTTAFRVPASAVRTNETAATATDIQLPTFAASQPPPGNAIWRSISTTVSGKVWRMNTGTLEGPFTQEVNFEDSNDAPPVLQAPSFPAGDITQDPGRWVDSDGNTVNPIVEEDKDWYRFSVAKNDLITISWQDSDKLDTSTGSPFPVWLNTTDDSRPALVPIADMSATNSRTYYFPADGFAVTRACLATSFNNTFNSTGSRLADRSNPGYTVTFTRYRAGDRAVVIDPLMATRLDKSLDLRDGRRLNFAQFPQLHRPTGTIQQTAIPRLNRQVFATSLASGAVDAAIAMADWTFRDQDSVAVSQSGDELAAPQQLYDFTSATPPASSLPLRRQSEGKGSWLVMLAPQDAGPVSVNWRPGKAFRLSLVVFNNRTLPAIANNADVSGEYALSGTWSDLDGTIAVTAPADTFSDDQELRDLFRAGSYVLLAPAGVSDASSVTQRFDWVRIQTSRINGSSDGGRTVTIMPETQPSDDVLSYGLRTVPYESPLAILAYQGVVSVVTKTIYLKP